MRLLFTGLHKFLVEKSSDMHYIMDFLLIEKYLPKNRCFVVNGAKELVAFCSQRLFPFIDLKQFTQQDLLTRDSNRLYRIQYCILIYYIRIILGCPLHRKFSLSCNHRKASERGWHCSGVFVWVQQGIVVTNTINVSVNSILFSFLKLIPNNTYHRTLYFAQRLRLICYQKCPCDDINIYEGVIKLKISLKVCYEP